MKFDVNTYQSNGNETARIVANGAGQITPSGQDTIHWKAGDVFDARRALTDECIEIRFVESWVAIRIAGPFFQIFEPGNMVRAHNRHLPERTDSGFVAHLSLYEALDAAKTQLSAIKTAKKALSK